jgi:hypothetical protein
MASTEKACGGRRRPAKISALNWPWKAMLWIVRTLGSSGVG